MTELSSSVEAGDMSKMKNLLHYTGPDADCFNCQLFAALPKVRIVLHRSQTDITALELYFLELYRFAEWIASRLSTNSTVDCVFLWKWMPLL